MRAAAILLGLVLATPASAKPRMCVSAPMPPRVIKSRSGLVAGTGGVVIASGQKMPDWRFRGMNRVLRPLVTPVAPGLAIYHPPPLPSTAVVLEDGDHSILVNMVRALTIEDKPGAPEVAAIKAGPVLSGDREAVVVKLSGERPERALIAVLSHTVRGRLVPMLWAPVGGDRAAPVVLWQAPYACQETIPSAVKPKAGERVVLTWIDEAGRVSEPSRSIVVASARTWAEVTGP